jgi:hypothetical protein
VPRRLDFVVSSVAAQLMDATVSTAAEVSQQVVQRARAWRQAYEATSIADIQRACEPWRAKSVIAASSSRSRVLDWAPCKLIARDYNQARYPPKCDQ